MNNTWYAKASRLWTTRPNEVDPVNDQLSLELTDLLVELQPGTSIVNDGAFGSFVVGDSGDMETTL